MFFGGDETVILKDTVANNEVSLQFSVDTRSADFSVTITSQASTIKQGESASFTVKLDKVGEFDQAVALVATGLTTGAARARHWRRQDLRPTS
jgi:uncharacterized membrane protein